jgi:hypothetical protein
MASNKKKGGKGSKKDFPQMAPAVNAFENDGSFLDSFKKQIEEYQRQRGDQSVAKHTPEVVKTQATHPELAEVEKSDPVATKDTELPCYTTQTMYYKDSEGAKKPQYQVIYLLSLIADPFEEAVGPLVFVGWRGCNFFDPMYLWGKARIPFLGNYWEEKDPYEVC